MIFKNEKSNDEINNIKIKKILIIFLIILLLVLFIVLYIYIKTPEKETKKNKTIIKNITFEKMEKMSDDEIVYMLDNITDKQLADISYYRNEKLNKDFHIPDNFSVELEKGTFGNGEFYYREKWYIVNGSFPSLEAANNMMTSYADEEYSIDYIGENDYYYEFREVDKSTSPTYRYLLYKDSIVKYKDYFLFSDGTKGYRFTDMVFQKKDYETILTIMDLENLDTFYRSFKENNHEFIYTSYEITRVVGDYNLNDECYLEKTEVRIDKNTGEILSNNKIEINRTEIK